MHAEEPTEGRGPGPVAAPRTLGRRPTHDESRVGDARVAMKARSRRLSGVRPDRESVDARLGALRTPGSAPSSAPSPAPARPWAYAGAGAGALAFISDHGPSPTAPP